MYDLYSINDIRGIQIILLFILIMLEIIVVLIGHYFIQIFIDPYNNLILRKRYMYGTDVFTIKKWLLIDIAFTTIIFLVPPIITTIILTNVHLGILIIPLGLVMIINLSTIKKNYRLIR